MSVGHSAETLKIKGNTASQGYAASLNYTSYAGTSWFTADLLYLHWHLSWVCSTAH